MSRAKAGPCSILILVFLACAAPLTAQKAAKDKEPKHATSVRGVIWRDPGRMASLNLLYGAGGKKHAPDLKGTFTFLKEDTQASSPKFDVVDRQGVQWKVKLGDEPQSETAATRFLWAAGYFVDEDYYLSELTVTGLPKLHRGESFVSPGGRIRGARLERKLADAEKLGTWDWFDNPFIDKRELNGLRVMMALLNNWDLKDVNNSIHEIRGERRYMVSDLGASFGNTGNSFTRSKSAPQEYADSKFIDKATSGLIDFVLHSRPFFLLAVNVPNYQARTKMEAITRGIPRADAKWLGHRLSMLSGQQISDCFRAAGYPSDEIGIYAEAVRQRIAELNAL
jgi:hypothetical protein